MKITVIGGKGRIGGTLCEIFREKGHEVTPLDAGDSIVVEEIVSRSDLIFLAIPIREAISYIERSPENSKFVEISSVKSPFRKYSGSIISIHPLFGPKSAHSGEANQIVFISDISREGSLQIITELFDGYIISGMSAEEHDRAMCNLLVSPYIISKLSKRVLHAEPALSTNSFRKANEISTLIDDESEGVVNDTISLNPYVSEIFGEFRKQIENIMEESI